MNVQIAQRGSQKRRRTKLGLRNALRSGARLTKRNISRACCKHALSIHKSRQTRIRTRASRNRTRIRTRVDFFCRNSDSDWYPRTRAQSQTR